MTFTAFARSFALFSIAISIFFLIVALQGCGDVGSSESNVVTNQDSPVDNSEGNVFGDTECTTTCTPVDSINCNNEDSEIAVTNNQCFLVVRSCEGPQQPDGPDLTTVPPIECVQNGDDPIVLPTPFPPVAANDAPSTGNDFNFDS